MERIDGSGDFRYGIVPDDVMSDQAIYRELPWIRLPLSGAPPDSSAGLTPTQRSDLERQMADCLVTSRQLSLAARRVAPREMVDTAAVRLAWSRFFLSHFAFFYNFAFLGDCYRAICATLNDPDPKALTAWIDRACALWRSAGAFMLYGVDFSPTEEIYKLHLRSCMPEGLSGTWLREYKHLGQHKRVLQGALTAAAGERRPLLADAHGRLRQAEKDYHLQHSQVMQACVPEMVSLLQNYEVAHGPLNVAEEQFRIYDDWFHVSRSQEIDRLEYLQKACAVFFDVAEDILGSTGLRQETLSFLEQGIEVMLDIMAEQMLRRPGDGVTAAGRAPSNPPVRDRLSTKPARISDGILGTVGGTPLVRLRRFLPHRRFDLFAKLEALNPGGSIKDRPAVAILEEALQTGAVTPGALVIESSSGNMGVGLAQACRYYGLRFLCVVDPKTAPANLRMLRVYGAEIEYVDEPDPETGEFLQARLNRVRELVARNGNAFWPNQYANGRNPGSHYETTMHEVASALGGRVDFLFVATSTCGTIRGCKEYIRDHGMSTRVIAVDAVGSLIFSNVKASRLIPGLGAGLRPPLCDVSMIDECVHVTDLDCIAGCRRLVAREAILAGGSSGGVLAAVEKIEERIPDGATCVAILPDRGDRYLETLFSDEWVRDHFGEVEHLWREPRIQPAAMAG